MISSNRNKCHRPFSSWEGAVWSDWWRVLDDITGILCSGICGAQWTWMRCHEFKYRMNILGIFNKWFTFSKDLNQISRKIWQLLNINSSLAINYHLSHCLFESLYSCSHWFWTGNICFTFCCSMCKDWEPESVYHMHEMKPVHRKLCHDGSSLKMRFSSEQSLEVQP